MRVSEVISFWAIMIASGAVYVFILKNIYTDIKDDMDYFLFQGASLLYFVLLVLSS